jgi:hypothetical protein
MGFSEAEKVVGCQKSSRKILGPFFRGQFRCNAICRFPDRYNVPKIGPVSAGIGGVEMMKCLSQRYRMKE